MDTSKDYYESVMRDFAMYGRGRSLEQFCIDQAVNYRWLVKAQSQYGIPEKNTTKTARRNKTKTPDMIQLHFEPEDRTDNAEAEKPDVDTPANPEQTVTQDAIKGSWSIMSLMVMTPSGYEIEIRTDKPSAVSELLAKLTA